MKVLTKRRSREQLAQRLTLSTTPAPIYGCSGLFDICGSADLMSLSFQGMSAFLDWIGWEGTDVCNIHEYFVHWARPAYSGGNPTVGYLADPCADPNGVEWGICDYKIDDFARLRRHGPVRDITKTSLRYCEAQPRYRLDGTPIVSDLEYDIRITTEVILQDLRRMVVEGNAATPGQMDGLERFIRTGYTDSQGRRCAAMDSIVIDWNGNGMDGGSGITWNGVAASTVYNFISYLLAAYRQIRQRISWAPALAAQELQVGDIIWVGPTTLNRCLLNAFTCWSVCPGVQYREANLNTFDARSFRDSLNTSSVPGANGRIFLDGFEIPVFDYDWGLIKGPTRFDGYLLTRGVGGTRLLRGQYNNMERVVRDAPQSDIRFSATDGGRLLTWDVGDHTCNEQVVEMQPRVVASGPWAQARFQDIVCDQPGPVLSPDPTATSFFPETSFFVAGS